MFSEKVEYPKLNARQKEIYNFQKASAVFADYGYTTIKLSDDWMGADFLAISFNGSKYLKIQLKSRLTFEKKYLGKDIFVCFYDKKSGTWYVYAHDEMLNSFISGIENSDSWKISGGYSFPYLNDKAQKCLSQCALG
ncbi:MAG: hypothetical protein WC848_02480 [Parcubacteria group bacterium]|jgi:hypothetical protein